MPCPELPYHAEIPYLTLLAIMLNVFEIAHSPHSIASRYTSSTNTQMTHYCSCPYFFWLAIWLMWVIQQSRFTYTPWIRVLFNGWFLKLRMWVFMSYADLQT